MYGIRHQCIEGVQFGALQLVTWFVVEQRLVRMTLETWFGRSIFSPRSRYR